MTLFNNFLPPFYIIINYIIFYIFFRKKYKVSDSLIFGYLSSSIFIITTNKIFLLSKIIFLYKFFIFILIIIFLILIKKNFILIKKDSFYLKDLKRIFGNKFFYFFIIFVSIYSLFQSIVIPPTNFDSFMYNITRNYIFVMENSIYPKNNFTTQWVLIMPLNSDLQFLTHAVFNSDFFMNIYNFYGYFIMSVIIYKILEILNVKKKNLIITLFLFLSLSNIFLSQFNTKNDLLLVIFFLMIVYFLFQILKNNNYYIPFILLSLAFSAGIKWSSFFFIAPLLIILIITIYYKKLFLPFFKNTIIYSPIILLALPLEIAYFNIKYINSVTGGVDEILTHNDGIKGMLANLIRYFISSIDLTFPVHKFGLKIITDNFDNINSYLQESIFHDNTLGLSPVIKDSVFFNYSYILRPHSDFAFFGIFGSFLFICPFLVHKAKNIYQKILCFIGIFFILTISYKISWFPWNARYIAVFITVGFLFFASFSDQLINKFKKFIEIYIIILISFNLFTHIPQPLIKHSQTDSWINATLDREKYKKFTIPEIENVKKIKKYIKNGDTIIVMMERNKDLVRLEGPIQSNYQIMREFNKSYIKFVDTEFKSLDLPKFRNEKLNINEIKNYIYIINFSNNDLSNKGYQCISCLENSEYKIYLTK
jgi:hypothetical protein